MDPSVHTSTVHPNELGRVDVFVGTRVRLRREAIGMSRADLALALGADVEFVERVESGDNRLESPQLVNLSQVLGIAISWFFDGLSSDVEFQFGGGLPDAANVARTISIKQENELLLANFELLAQPRNRQMVIDLARRLADLEIPHKFKRAAN